MNINTKVKEQARKLKAQAKRQRKLEKRKAKQEKGQVDVPLHAKLRP